MFKVIFASLVFVATASQSFAADDAVAAVADKSQTEPVCDFTTTKGSIIHAPMNKRVAGDNTFVTTDTDTLDISISTKADVSAALISISDKSGQELASAKGGSSKGLTNESLELSAVIGGETYIVECTKVKVAK